jgi:uncharacterized phage protein (TIGR01671 family)
MRKIWFRGKRVDGRGWVHGYYLECNGPCILDDDEMFFGREDGVEGMYEVDPATVGEYTGVEDRNGKMVFEGDVIKTHSGIVGRIAFGNHYDDESGFCSNGWFFAGRDEAGDDCTLSLTDEWSGHMVIGNIHDNPELVEAQHE